jgi:hypothetical protein
MPDERNPVMAIAKYLYPYHLPGGGIPKRVRQFIKEGKQG